MEATYGIVRNFQWMLEGTTYESDLIMFPVGKYDLVLGALWMKTLGPVTMDYSALTMTYNYLGKQHVLKGVPDACRLSSPKAVNKSNGNDVELFMYSSMKKDIIEKLVKGMLRQGVIQYSNSPFSSPVVVVGKKDGSWRFLSLVDHVQHLQQVFEVMVQHKLLSKRSNKDLAPRHIALSIYESELLALVFAVTKWSHYLLNRHFTVKIDQKALKGKDNIVVDTLSRVRCAELISLLMNSVQTDLWKEIQDSWFADLELAALIASLQHTPQEHITWLNQQLKRKGKLLVGNDWKGIHIDIVDFIHKCNVCQRNKYDIVVSPDFLQPLPIHALPWTDITMDFIEDLPKSKGKFDIWVIIDRLTKHSHFIVLSHPYTAQSLVPIFLDNIFRHHGFPASITSDRDPIFISTFWKEFLISQSVILQTSTAYHPQTDGQSEILNRCLETYLHCFCIDSPTDWSLFLALAE
ncbi:uncharacterized protein [Nicotiana sylvestris]|uniref:uncharacterized protein n=1 Tax=Nicotiana sylvestris TaxID=4096 RepID=UPI00388C9FDD